jgi:hypothetical protein
MSAHVIHVFTHLSIVHGVNESAMAGEEYWLVPSKGLAVSWSSGRA